MSAGMRGVVGALVVAATAVAGVRVAVAGTYRFQARLVPQPGYPYRGATSRRVSVIVEP